MTEVGVEPTHSPGSRPGRFANLRTRPSSLDVSHAGKWPVQVSHLAVEAYETSLGAGPRRQLFVIADPGNDPGIPAL